MIIWNTQYCYGKDEGLTLVNGNHHLIGDGWHEDAIHFPTVRGLLKYLRTEYPNKLWKSKLSYYYGTIVEIKAGRKLED